MAQRGIVLLATLLGSEVDRDIEIYRSRGSRL